MKKIKIETQKSKIHLAQHMFSFVLTFVFKNHYFKKYRGSRGGSRISS
jgi:hypothetical protein